VRAKRPSKGDGPGRASFEVGAREGALAAQDDGARGRQRIDKWLWHARMVRTRSDAAALAASGHIRLNGKRVDAASQLVRAGDVLTIALDRTVRVVEVAGFSDRRGGAPLARTFYRELKPQR
jgi:ribosome-associated heat shock protein Hsp15